MPQPQSQRRTVTVGTNPRTGSPIKLPKYNRRKATSSTGQRSRQIPPTPAATSPLSKRKNKNKSANTSLMCNGKPIELPVPYRRFTSSQAGISDVAMADKVSETVQDDNPPSPPGEALPMEQSFFMEPLPLTDNRQQNLWLQQLPAFKGSDKLRRQNVWPKWRDDILPLIAPIFLEAEAMVYNGTPLPPPPTPGAPSVGRCDIPDCTQSQTTTTVQCIDRTVIHEYTILHCASLKCAASLVATLVKSGFFPCSPQRSKTAFSFEILESYLAINVQSSCSPSVFRVALVNGLRQRRYALQGVDPWRNQLPDAILWFDALKRFIEVKFSELVQSVEEHVFQQGPLTTPDGGELAAYILRKRCPWCFGRRTWGGDPETNPDVLLCIDACFQHRRYSNIGDDPTILQDGDSFFFLSTESIQAAKQHCEERRNNNKPSNRQDARVPSGSLDQCGESHNAATNKGNDESDNLYASKAIMNIVCRHDKPLFACDIHTPGEQRFYAIALIQAVVQCLPARATIGLLYDIACQLDRSIAKHDLIPDIAPRLSCATALFHAYAHQMSCQWVYHPRRRTGFGWTNGEGNERIWALSRDTISQQRIMGPHRRLFYLARKFEYISTLKNTKGGDWQDRKWKDIKKAKSNAEQYLAGLGSEWTRPRLREEYASQQRTQLSIRAYNAQVASRNLATLIDTQRSADSLTLALDSLNKELDNFEYQQRMLGVDCGEVRALYNAANELQRHHQESMQRLQDLTADLGLLQTPLPPTIVDADRPFVKQLILIHTMKTALWTRLQRLQDEMSPIRDSARRSGAGQSLGTKRLQTAVRTIQTRGRHILSVVDTYNKLVDELWTLPLPSWFAKNDLPAKLERKGLLAIGPDADVWEEIAMSQVWFSLWGNDYQQAPAYVRDPAVRKGVQLLLELDRIAEEQCRLTVEKENLICEFALEIFALHHALHNLQENDTYFQCRLQQRLESLLQNRHNFIKGKNRPNMALWRLQVNDVVQFVTENNDASALQQPMHSFMQMHATSVRGAPLWTPDDATAANDFQLSEGFDLFGDNAEGGDEPDVVKDMPGMNNAGGGGGDDLEADNIDPEESATDDVLASLTDDVQRLHMEEEEPHIQLTVPGSDLPNDSFPPGDQPTLARQRRGNDSLPSVRALFEVLRADEMGSTEEVLQASEARIWTAVARGMVRVSAPRVAVDLKDRQCQDFIIHENDLKCLDSNRHLKMRVVAGYCRLITKYFHEHTLNRIIPQDKQPNLWLIDPGCLEISPQVMLYLFIDGEGKVRADRFTHDAWLMPWYSSVREHWILGIVDWKRRKFWYCDSRPLCHRDPLREGDASMWQKLQRFTAVACALVGISEDVFSWGLGNASLVDRLRRKTDSGLWVLADIEGWYLGMLHADRDMDMDAYRLVVRQAICHLPHAVQDGQPIFQFPASTTCTAWKEKLKEVIRVRPWTSISVPRHYRLSKENPLDLDSDSGI